MSRAIWAHAYRDGSGRLTCWNCGIVLSVDIGELMFCDACWDVRTMVLSHHQLAAMERAVVNLHRIPAARLGTTAYDARQRRNGYDWLSPGIVSSELRLLAEWEADPGMLDRYPLDVGQVAPR